MSAEQPDSTSTSDAPLVLTAEERTELLNDLISNWMAKGYRVESQADFSAIMVKGHRVNHVLHLLLSIVTLGAWLIVWFFIACFGGERRHAITVDEYGR